MGRNRKRSLRHKKPVKLLKRRQVLKLVNDECMICKYDKCVKNLSFHHIDPKTKRFNLSSREFNKPLDVLLNEIHKCIIVCQNCHGEIHDDLVNYEKIWQAHVRFIKLLEQLPKPKPNGLSFTPISLPPLG